MIIINPNLPVIYLSNPWSDQAQFFSKWLWIFVWPFTNSNTNLIFTWFLDKFPWLNVEVKSISKLNPLVWWTPLFTTLSYSARHILTTQNSTKLGTNVLYTPSTFQHFSALFSTFQHFPALSSTFQNFPALSSTF